jgi:hypothetical protein
MIKINSVRGAVAGTQAGPAPIVGNNRIVPGQVYAMIDGHLISRIAQQRKIITTYPAGTGPVIITGKYRFADAVNLKMYYVTKDLQTIALVKDIVRPVESAELLLHCYNASAEYLVWFVGARCIIQKDGETIADFTSVFADTPDRSDAYIDNNEKLQWVAATKYPIVLATYDNGALVNSCTDYASRAMAKLNESAYNAQTIRNAQRASVSASWGSDVDIDSGIYFFGPKDSRARSGSDYPGSVFAGSCETSAQMTQTNTATDYQIGTAITDYLHVSLWAMAVFGRMETEIGNDDFETVDYVSDVVDYVTAAPDADSRTGRVSGSILSLTTAHDMIILPDDETIASTDYIGAGGAAGGAFN